MKLFSTFHLLNSSLPVAAAFVSPSGELKTSSFITNRRIESRITNSIRGATTQQKLGAPRPLLFPSFSLIPCLSLPSFPSLSFHFLSASPLVPLEVGP